MREISTSGWPARGYRATAKAITKIRAILSEMLFMEELQEVRQMVTQQMETSGFVRPTFFLVGSKSRLRYILTSVPGDLDEATAVMLSLGKRLTAEHLEVGKLVRAYLAIIGLIT